MQSALSRALPDSDESDEPHATLPPLRGASMEDGGETPYVIPDATGSLAYELTKRAIDITIGTMGLLVATTVSLALIPYIRHKSEGPAIFRQTRIGKGGRPFTCYKFRTMQVDAESRKAQLQHLNEVIGPAFKLRNDPRSVDDLRWLRKTSLDELPQFWNVVRGDMSLVGPRPSEPHEVSRYTERELGRLAVKPGLTCIWQVEGRSDLDFDTWMAMDLDYIQRRSTRFDLKLLAKTIPAVLTGRGAA